MTGWDEVKPAKGSFFARVSKNGSLKYVVQTTLNSVLNAGNTFILMLILGHTFFTIN